MAKIKNQSNCRVFIVDNVTRITMWMCPLCGREFANNNAVHSCREKELSDFLNGKPQHVVDLFFCFADACTEFGDIKISPAKSMISFASIRRFAYVIQIGKAFIDVVLPFKKAYEDNLCFNKIKPVPESDDFNHHLRIYAREDINTEVKMYIGIAYRTGL